MTVMDMEPGPPANEDTNRGKRKRSSNESSPTQWSGTIQNPEDHNPGGQQSPRPGGVQLPKKLKVEPDTLALDSDGDTTIPDAVLDQSLMELPDQILQHILSFLDPFSLARVMCVNHRFSGLLDPQQVSTRSSGLPTRQSSLTPELIWSCSRRSHIPGMPHPLKGVTEFGMFKLVFGKRCQVCGLLPRVSSSKLAATPWNSGPGPMGVRPIWPLKSRLCANCLQPLLLKEADLAQLDISELQRGLVSVWFTPSLHYVTSITLGQTPKPSGLSLTKYYFRPQLDELSRLVPDLIIEGGTVNPNRFNDLDALRQEAVTDAVRLEAWELSKKADDETAAASRSMAGRSSASGSSLHSDMRTRSFITSSSGTHRPYAPMSNFNRTSLFPGSSSLHHLNFDSQMLPPLSEVKTTQKLTTASTGSHTSLQVRQSSEPPQLSDYRAPLDVTKMKAERRLDIESRCMKLDPPLTPRTLERLPAFQAAIKIPRPLGDGSWNFLKAHLVEQKVKEESYNSTGSGFHSRASSPGQTAILRISTPPDVQIEDDPRTHAHRPVREKLHEFAGELIRSRYAQGNSLTQSSAPQFAADVLLHVRRRFYENQAREDAAFVANRQQPPDEGPGGTRARVLRLEHMKYVFDTSIKPLTEFVRKELFLCRMCDTQGRHFGFEAIIQHYASKHTDDFSHGTAVVHWKAKWPEKPPFHPHPSADTEWLTDRSHIPPGSYAPTSAQSSQSFRAPSSTDIVGEHRNPRFSKSSRESFDSQRMDIRDRQQFQGPDAYTDNSVTPISQSWPRPYDHSTIYTHNQNVHTVYQQPRSTHALVTQPSHDGSIVNQSSLSFPYEVPLQTVGPSHGQYQQDGRHYRERQVPAESAREYDRFHDGRVHTRPFDSTYQHDQSSTHGSAGRYSSSFAEQPRQLTREYLNEGVPDNVRNTVGYQNVSQSSVTREAAPATMLDTKHEAAEHFLNTLNADEVQTYGKEPLRQHSTRENTQPYSSDEMYWREATADRRSNMSQPLRRSRSSVGEQNSQYPVESITRPVEVVNLQTHADRRPIDDPYLAREAGFVYQPGNEYSYQNEHHTQITASVPPDSQGYQASSLVGHETRANIHQSPPSQYVDRRVRRIELHGHETRYLDGSLQGDARYDEQVRYSHEAPAIEHRYEHRLYEPREAAWDPELGRHYVERRVREYLPEQRYVRYERIHDRDDVHEDSQSLYRQSSRRPPSSDQRYRDH